MRTAIDSAARFQQMWGVLARRGRLGECLHIDGDLLQPRLEAEFRTDSRPMLAVAGRRTAAAFSAARPLVAHGAGPARPRFRTPSRRAGL